MRTTKVILMISSTFLMEDTLMRGHGLPILVKSDLGKDWLTQQFAYVIINGDVQKCGSGIDKNNNKK